MKRFTLWVTLLATMLGGSLWTASVSVAHEAQENTVVLISIDGFRHDYLELHDAPNIAAIAAQGVRADGLMPVYPAKTFPNHLSIVTGQYPAKHGIVDNHFYDTERQQHYRMGDGVKDSTWLTTVPLWNLAEFQGVRAATFFWPESEARINGRTPTYYYNYSTPAPNRQRVQQMIDWLKLPEAVRPRLVIGYFSVVDTMGHRFGPESVQVNKAITHVDELIGQLWHAIQHEVEVPVTLLLVSDHGMSTITADAMIDVQELTIPAEQFEVINAQTRLLIYTKPETTEAQVQALRERLQQQAQQRYYIESPTQLAQLGVTPGPRQAAIVLGTQAPVTFTQLPPEKRRDGGTHGYHSSREMDGIFIAAGDGIRTEVRLARFSNIHIYPFVAELLGLELMSDIDGDGAVLAPLLPQSN